MSRNRIFEEDMEYIFTNLSERDKLSGSRILITGCAGFLGYYFMNFFTRYSDKLGIKEVIGLDNFILKKPKWVDQLVKDNDRVKIHHFDIIRDDLSEIKGDADYVIHMASIASPHFYRKYPIETLDANVFGLKRLLERYKDSGIKGFLFFSSSEVYGDPYPEFIPTDEEYRGNVATIGPRACYDEGKRVCETMCYLYAKKHDMPVVFVRPFNNYGPGMSPSDRRVPADFAKAILDNRDIEIYSDGRPTRTFCYVSDAVLGYLKALLYGKFGYFNIGIDGPEISVGELAETYKKCGKLVFGYSGEISYKSSQEKEYLTDNPNRRCPKIEKAKRMLGYDPRIKVEEGVRRFLEYLKGERALSSHVNNHGGKER
ncbi:NAD-dependent epimerase/dehydratase family protein [Candidatus Woesearchaeota archaeon]|nr:NAD-dependent epimerase/dehydratase family protein [Candidatus Woesearchaeota archaeon]